MVESSMENILEGKEDNSRMTQKVGTKQLEGWNFHSLSWKSLSHSKVFATPWTVAHQAPLLLRFPRQEYWNKLLFPSLRDLLSPGTEPTSPALAGGFFTTDPPGSPNCHSSYFTYMRRVHMQNARLDKSQAGSKASKRNINISDLRHADPSRIWSRTKELLNEGEKGKWVTTLESPHAVSRIRSWHLVPSFHGK